MKKQAIAYTDAHRFNDAVMEYIDTSKFRGVEKLERVIVLSAIKPYNSKNTKMYLRAEQARIAGEALIELADRLEAGR